MSAKKERKKEDVRGLCQRCRMEYENAGIKTNKTNKKTKCRCWKCDYYNAYEYTID